MLAAAILLMESAAPAAGQSSPQDYPQWRGQNRDGAASSFSEPAKWPDSLTRRWKVDVGEGYATPIVVGSVVYVFTRRNGSEVMMALNAGSGNELWRTTYPAPYTPSSPAAGHGAGPKATPLFYDGKLFALGISGIVSAFDATSGKIVWQTPAPAEHPFYGASVSPLADNGLVIVHPGNYGPLTAYDARTGDVKWTWTGDGGAFASPIIAEIDGVRQVVSVMDHYVVGVSVADGALLWQHPWGRSLHITPVLYDGTIIVSGQNMGVTALKPLRRDGTWTVNVAWETKEVSMFLSNPVIVGDTLFGLSHRASGQYFALDARTGKVLWLGPPRQATNTAVVSAGPFIILLNDNAELIVVRSSETAFEPIKRYTVADSATWAQPAISGNRVFVKDVSSLALWTVN